MKFISFSIALFSLVFAANAQSTLTPENLWKLNRVYGEQVSPDGKSLIYAQKSYQLEEDKGTTHLMKMPAVGGDAKMISDGKSSVYEAQWRPDGKKIGYLSLESGSMQLWEMNPDGTGAKQMSDLEGGISNFHYAPDMKHVSFTMEVKVEESLADKHTDLPQATGKAYDNLMFRHWTQWHDYTYQHVFIADYTDQIASPITDIMKGEAFDAPMMPFGGSEQIAWAPDGQSLVYVCKKKTGKDYAVSTNSELWHYDLKTGETRNLTDAHEGYDNEPVFSNDGKWLAWSSMARDGFESDKNMLWILNMETGTQFPLAASLDQSFGNVVWGEDSKNIYAISGVSATFQIFKMDLKKDGSDKLKIGGFNALTDGDHNINSIALAGGKLVGSMNTMSQPAELYSWDIKSREVTQITHANDEMLGAMKMGKVEKRMIKTTDGKDMLTWVIYPPDFDPNKKYPTLLYCQGGPQSAVSQFFSYRWNFQLMAANGYIIVAPNRRGLPSFGQEWNDQISKDWGGQAMKDYLSAIDEVAKEPFVDNDNLGAVGASYGGYSVYYLAGIHEGRFKCFISHCGLFNLESWYASTEELFFANWDIGGPYWDPSLKDAYAKNSPHKMVANWDTPIMVIHNELDFRVPLNQGLEAFTAAQLKGIPSKLLYYPDEGHWVLKPQNGVMWHREFYDWLDTYLK
ncbi:S9 family peptidase [Salibacteraceae bacterium]|nr:S9 family peptidase [Salibacteraceae bacterium]